MSATPSGCWQHGDSPDTTMASLGPQVWKPQVILLTSCFLLACGWARLRCWVEAGCRCVVVEELSPECLQNQDRGDHSGGDQLGGAGVCDWRAVAGLERINTRLEAAEAAEAGMREPSGGGTTDTQPRDGAAADTADTHTGHYYTTQHWLKYSVLLTLMI